MCGIVAIGWAYMNGCVGVTLEFELIGTPDTLNFLINRGDLTDDLDLTDEYNCTVQESLF